MNTETTTPAAELVEMMVEVDNHEHNGKPVKAGDTILVHQSCVQMVEEQKIATRV